MVLIILFGLFVGLFDVLGIWDLSNIDDVSGGMDVIMLVEWISLVLFKEWGLLVVEWVEGVFVVVVVVEGKVSVVISNLNFSVSLVVI